MKVNAFKTKITITLTMQNVLMKIVVLITLTLAKAENYVCMAQVM